MGATNQKPVREQKVAESAIPSIIEECEKLAKHIQEYGVIRVIKGNNFTMVDTNSPTGGKPVIPISPGQQALYDLAQETTSDKEKQIAIMKTYLLNVSSWESIGVFYCLPSKDNKTFIIPKGTVIWSRNWTTEDGTRERLKEMVGRIAESRLDDYLGSSLEMAYVGNKGSSQDIRARFLSNDVRLFPIEQKQAVLSLIDVIDGKEKIPTNIKESVITSLKMISGYGNGWFDGIKQRLMGKIEQSDIFLTIINTTPRHIAGQRNRYFYLEQYLMTKFKEYHDFLNVDGWIGQAGILSEAEMMIKTSAYEETKTKIITLAEAHAFLRQKTHLGFDYSYVQQVKTTLRRRLPEFLIFITAVAAAQAWWINKSRRMFQTVQDSWMEHRKICLANPVGKPTKEFLKATLVASKYMVPANFLFDRNGDLLHTSAICSHKFDKLSRRDMLRSGLFLLFTLLTGSLSIYGISLLYLIAQHPWEELEKSILKPPVNLQDLTKTQ